MANVLILCAHRPNRSPSQRYRFEQYLPILENEGFKFTWSYLLNEHDDKIFYSRGNLVGKAFILLKSFFKRKRDAARFKNFDIIFIQREALFTGGSFFEKKAFHSGARVIFDFDDSIWLADTSPGNKKWEWLKKPGKFFDNARNAHWVIAGNNYLAKQALTVNKNTTVIPTSIDTGIHFPKPGLRGKEKLIIGWSGSISTVKHFEIIVPVLKKLKEKYGDKIGFKIIGDKNYINNTIEVSAVEWRENTEVDELNSIDVGIMPLPDDEWSKGKCGLKGLSYMACGIPVVLSAVGVNNEIILNGVNGFIARNETEWMKSLSELAENKELREKLGAAGRKTVEEKYSVKANQNKYLEVFSNAGAH